MALGLADGSGSGAGAEESTHEEASATAAALVGQKLGVVPVLVLVGAGQRMVLVGEQHRYATTSGPAAAVVPSTATNAVAATSSTVTTTLHMPAPAPHSSGGGASYARQRPPGSSATLSVEALAPACAQLPFVAQDGGGSGVCGADAGDGGSSRTTCGELELLRRDGGGWAAARLAPFAWPDWSLVPTQLTNAAIHAPLPHHRFRRAVGGRHALQHIFRVTHGPPLNVRAGPGREHAPLFELSPPYAVHVIGRLGLWMQITLPFTTPHGPTRRALWAKSAPDDEEEPGAHIPRWLVPHRTAWGLAMTEAGAEAAASAQLEAGTVQEGDEEELRAMAAGGGGWDVRRRHCGWQHQLRSRAATVAAIVGAATVPAPALERSRSELRRLAE